jgi:hypothetical protein
MSWLILLFEFSFILYVIIVFVPQLIMLLFSSQFEHINNGYFNYFKLLYLSYLIKLKIINVDENILTFYNFILTLLLNLTAHIIPIPILSDLLHTLTITTMSIIYPKISFILRILLIFLKYRNFLMNHTSILIFILYSQLIMSVMGYDALEYLNLINFNSGSCSINNHFEMFSTLWEMFIDLKSYCNKNKITERGQKKFKILDIDKNKTHKISNNDLMNEPLIKKTFGFNGRNIVNNVPHKIHSCNYNCWEAAYRQLQSKIDYDDDEMNNFEIFAKNKLNELILPNNENKTKTVEEYLKSVGSKMKNFYKGYKEFKLYDNIVNTMKMHVKTDEKIYINWDKIKEKARNVTAQNDRNKLIMGVVVDYLMKIMDKEEWSGPSKNPLEKCNIFSKFMEDVVYDQIVVCADGSAFDSTQHKRILEIVDCYAYKLIIENHPELFEIAPKEIFEKICYQTRFLVRNKYISYEVEGTQMTGRMNTCQGNTLRSWLYVEYIKYLMKKENPNIDLNRIKEMVNGDDQIIFMPKKYYELYVKIARKHVYADEDIPIKHGLGQIAKIFDKYEDITGAEFLSCIVLYNKNNNKFLLVRKIERFLQLTPYTFNNNFKNYNRLREYNALLTIADAQNILSGEPLTIFKKYAMKMYEIGLKEKEKFRPCKKVNKAFNKYKEYVDLYKNKYKGIYYGHEFDEIYEDWLYKTYNIDKDDIEEFYELLEKVNEFNFLDNNFQCNLIDKLYKIDYKNYINNYNEIHKNDYEYIFKLSMKNKIIIEEYN